MSVKKKKNGGADGRERVALKNELVARVRKHKEKKGFPIALFIEKTVGDKLDEIERNDADKVGGEK